MLLPTPDQLTQYSWSTRCEDSLGAWKCLLQQSGDQQLQSGGNSTLFQTHQALLPLEHPEDIVGMVQLRLCGASTLSPEPYPQPQNKFLKEKKKLSIDSQELSVMK